MPWACGALPRSNMEGIVETHTFTPGVPCGRNGKCCGETHECSRENGALQVDGDNVVAHCEEVEGSNLDVVYGASSLHHR